MAGRHPPLQYRLGFAALLPAARIGMRVVGWLPAPWMRAAGEAVWRLTYLARRRRVRRLEESIAVALGERFPDAADRRRLVRTSWRNLHWSALEATLAVAREDERTRLRELPIEGIEHLETALARGRGVLVLSAHLGGFTAIPIRLGALHPTRLVANRPDDGRTAAWLDEVRARTGFGTVPARPARAATRAALATLREGHILVLLADGFKSGGVGVRFLGHPASVPRGPATLALRAGAAVVPVFALRDDEDGLRLRVEPEIPIERSGDTTSDVANATARIAAAMEAQVLRTPEQWNWANFRVRARRPADKFVPLAVAEPTETSP